MAVTAEVKNWMDQHPRFYNDPAYYSHAVTAHHTAISEGYRAESPAYFRVLSEAMEKFEKFEAFDRGETQERQVTPRKPPPASSTAAPVSRGHVSGERSRGQPSAEEEARYIGVTVEDLREAAKWNGFVSGKRGYKSSDEAFAAYVKELREIRDIQSRGGDAGLRTDAVFR